MSHHHESLSAITRAKEHWQGYSSRNKNNPMHKHTTKDQQGRRDVDYKIEVVKTFGRDNMRRKLHEAVRIDRHQGVTMNSKSVYNQPILPRARIRRNANDE